MALSAQSSVRTDAQSLAKKLAEFDSKLTLGERAIFRSLMLADLVSAEDVSGHAMEPDWFDDPEVMYRRWTDRT